MTEACSPAFEDYQPAFERADEPFLFTYRLGDGGDVRCSQMSRGEFLSLARRAAAALRAAGCAGGDRVLHGFGANDPHDLALRLAGALIGTVPVTVNWQADTLERVVYKLRSTSARMAVMGSSFPADLLDGLRAAAPDLAVLRVEQIDDHAEIAPTDCAADVGVESEKIIIFTSGTTGDPKGVRLPYRSYRANRAAFEQMLGIGAGDRFAALVVNPMHHTNSTAITDWAMRRPGSHLHLVQRYSTQYWRILRDVAGRGYDRLVAPTVSRHFDFLDELAGAGRLPVPQSELTEAMAKVDFLIGSAPVGPTTVRRLQKYAGRTPAVRFGSTETCLQVMGIPHGLDEAARLAIFRSGWDHHVDGNALAGYYVGRPHPPHTEVRIVKSITRGADGYMADVPDGAPGYLITRGGNLMLGYVNDPAATAEVFEDGWYLGLRDIGFALLNPRDGERDYFWVSRDASMLIRGGANYSCDQIAAELSAFIARRYGLPRESFELAVVGLKIDSEHEDACCVTIALKTDAARSAQGVLAESFLREARAAVSKGTRPDHVRFGAIPRNFKGAVRVPKLKEAYRAHLTEAGVLRPPGRGA